MIDIPDIARTIDTTLDQPAVLDDPVLCKAVHAAIAALDAGTIRVAEKIDGAWHVHAWIKQAILLYFQLQPLEPITAGMLEFYDKVSPKKNLREAGIRVVPPGIARYGSFLEPGCILMPGYVNIGAYVAAGTMIDTWATVGSCAQIGAGVHVSGGVGIGGVLEPPGAMPVIIEDHAFIGSRCIVVEGMLIETEAVIGAGVTLTASTPIIDVTGAEPVITKGRIPSRAVVIPGTTVKKFPAGEFQVPCALIIGTRTAATDRKTSLNDTLRIFNLSS